jgi:hypothetical protein
MASQIANAAASPRLAHRPLRVGRSLYLTGPAIVSALQQLRTALPQRDCHRRASVEIQWDREKAVIPDPASSLIALARALRRHARVAAPPFVMVDRAAVPFARTQPTAGRAWIYDRAHSLKEGKYCCAVECIRSALDREFPRWQEAIEELRDELSHMPIEQRDPFTLEAYQALYGLAHFGEGDKSIREQYAQILHHVGAALRHPRKDHDSLKRAYVLLQMVCYFRMTEVCMYDHCERLVNEALGSNHQSGLYQIPSLTWENLASEIREANRRLAGASGDLQQTVLARESKRLQGTIGCYAESMNDSNVPWIQLVQQARTARGASRCTVLRHGTPTRDPGIRGALLRMGQHALGMPQQQQAVVTEEYKAYLGVCPNKTTLYCNHQEQGGSAEGNRSRAIEELQKDHRKFHVLSLPLDGPLWSDRSSLSYESLREQLLQRFADKRGGFAFPLNLPFPEHADKVREILDQVHQLYFNEVADLSFEDRKIFLLLFYSELKDYLKNVTRADFLVSACQDSTDRGNVSGIVDMVKNTLLLGPKDDREALRQVFYTVLAPFVVYNEQVDEQWLELALAVIRHLQSLSETQKQRIRDSEPASGYRITQQSILPGPSAVRGGGKAYFARTVHNLRMQRTMEEHRDLRFEVNLASSFLRDGEWDLPGLKEQVEKDLGRNVFISLNGERVTDFNALCNGMVLPPGLFMKKQAQDQLKPDVSKAVAFMAMLQQAATEGAIRPPVIHWNEAAGHYVAQPKQQTEELAVRDCVEQYRNALPEGVVHANELRKNPRAAPYLRWAVQKKLLPAECLPHGTGPALPLYPTRILARYNPETLLGALDIEQDMFCSIRKKGLLGLAVVV